MTEGCCRTRPGAGPGQPQPPVETGATRPFLAGAGLWSFQVRGQELR